jgi:hypothetical protein
MELRFLHVYQSLEQYNPDEQGAWEKCMIAPFWKQIAEWSPFPMDYMKPAPITNKRKLKQQLEHFREIDFDKV